ncbi:MAG: tetratricopeptide repeat protein [Pseudomonadota bacterium]
MSWFIKFVIIIISLNWIASCVTKGAKTSDKASGTLSKTLVERKDSLFFIPKRETDPETQQLKPYVKLPNPYLKPPEQISATAVRQYLNAKKILKSNQSQTAKNIVEKLTKEYPKLSGPWALLGDIYAKNNESQKVIEAYQQGIKVNPDNVNIYIKLAKYLRRQGQYEAAKSTYVDALMLWKDFPEAHLNIAVLYDVYMNEPLKAQRHMEAYQFLTEGTNKKVNRWLQELIKRTGKPVELKIEKHAAVSG